MLDRFVEAGLKLPTALTLSITNGCNLRCVHCWPESRPELVSAPVSSKVIIRLVDEFAAIGMERIIITGGEPLTHPDWCDILAWCCERSGISEVCLQTNGTALHDRQARRLAALGGAKLSIQMSLDGATRESHERVRGSGSHERALSGIRRLVAWGLGKRTRVAFTEMRHNFHEIPMMLELVEGLGLGGLVTGTLIRGGRATDGDDLEAPTPSQCEGLLRRYHTDSAFRSRYEKLGRVAAVEWHKGMRSKSFECGSECIESLYVTADGRMYPCALLQAEEYVIRNMHGRSSREALREALPLWARIPEMSRRRRETLSGCRECPGSRHCGGGCMGRAYAAYGSAMAVEDRCEMRQAVYSHGNGESLGKE